MDHTPANSLKTALKDRTLWYDGESTYSTSDLHKVLSKRDVKYVTQITPEIVQYNQMVTKSKEITTKEECNPLTVEWTIPNEYKSLDVVDWIAAKHDELTRGLSDKEITNRERRLVQELQKFKDFALFDVLRTIIWIINTLSVHNVVWGIGRGSSVSSYVLYVIGVHDIDSFEYDLDVDDFLHD